MITSTKSSEWHYQKRDYRNSLRFVAHNASKICVSVLLYNHCSMSIDNRSFWEGLFDRSFWVCTENCKITQKYRKKRKRHRRVPGYPQVFKLRVAYPPIVAVSLSVLKLEILTMSLTPHLVLLVLFSDQKFMKNKHTTYLKTVSIAP